MQRIVQACLLAEEQFQVVLPGWMRAYASAAWQDRYFAEQNFTPLQQVSATPQKQGSSCLAAKERDSSGSRTWQGCSLLDLCLRGMFDVL